MSHEPVVGRLEEYRKEKKEQPCCAGCGLEYGSDAWCDCVVPDDIWKLISPTGGEGGLLCFNCMTEAVVAIGGNGIPLTITSGPWFVIERGYSYDDER